MQTNCLVSRLFQLFLLAFVVVLFVAPNAMASLGCELNDAERDVPRLFPGSSGYNTNYVSFTSSGGANLLSKVEERLDRRYIPIYAPLNVPYTVYSVINDRKLIGYVHGVNQKGQYGGNQVFVSLDLTGKIKALYLQKISGKLAHKFRDPKFGRQFIGISMKDFDSYDPISGKGTGRLAEIKNPAPEAETDFLSIMRALKKNLILMEEFGYLKGRKK